MESERVFFVAQFTFDQALLRQLRCAEEESRESLELRPGFFSENPWRCSNDQFTPGLGDGNSNIFGIFTPKIGVS